VWWLLLDDSRPRKLGLQLGLRLRTARLSARQGRGLGQAELASALGISQATISDYERGRREPPLGTLVRLSQALGVPVGWLVTGSAGGAEGTAGTRQPQLLQESLAGILDLELVTYLGTARLADETGSMPLQAAETRTLYPVPASGSGRPLLMGRDLSAGATQAVLYVGSPSGPLASGDLLFVDPQLNDPQRWRLAAGPDTPQEDAYLLIAPGASSGGLCTRGTIVGLVRHRI